MFIKALISYTHFFGPYCQLFYYPFDSYLQGFLFSPKSKVARSYVASWLYGVWHGADGGHNFVWSFNIIRLCLQLIVWSICSLCMQIFYGIFPRFYYFLTMKLLRRGKCRKITWLKQKLIQTLQSRNTVFSQFD